MLLARFCLTQYLEPLMKKVIQPLAWYLLLTSILALASGFSLSLVTGSAFAAGLA